AVPAAHADHLVSQFGHDRSAAVRGLTADASADLNASVRTPTLFAARDDGRGPTRTAPGMVPESRGTQVGPLRGISPACCLLSLFPQYPLAPNQTSTGTPQQSSNTPVFNFIDPAFGLKDTPLLTTPVFSGVNDPPLSEAPEPAALLSGVLGAALTGTFVG